MLNFSGVPAELQASANTYWQQFEHNREQQQLPSLASQLPQGLSADDFARQLTRAFVASEFIAKTCALHPAYLLEQIANGELFSAWNEQHIAALFASTAQCNSDSELDACLRRLRQKAMIRLIWRDLNRLDSMQHITAELSRFADNTLSITANYHYRALQALHGTPIGRESGQAQPFMVLGMGKLGAGELNISSDIDLIFTFPEGGETDHASRPLSNQEFFVKLGQRLIKSLDSITADGFVFRVDMRLRPHGQSGSLALSFAGMENYYQTQGREWERYAMIKARTLAMAGGESDAQRHRMRLQLRSLLQPFTYRQYIDFSAIESLREMKGLIARQVLRKGLSLDVKLGEGGIREVEFIVQAFQLIRGGRDARLRKRRVSQLLPLLEQEGYLPPGAGAALLEAYVFLRNTEHAIQGYQDKQTQSLPTEPQGQLRLAWAMGFSDWERFFSQLSAYRKQVHSEFTAVIAAPDEDNSDSQKAFEFWLSLWEGSLGDEALQALIAQDVEYPESLLKAIADLQQSRALANMQTSGRARLDAFIPRLLHTLSVQSLGGKLALTVAQVFQRITHLIEAVARRSAYLVLLVENPSAIEQLVRLCDASPWIADQLAQYPALLDELLSPDSLYTPPDKAFLRNELRRELLRLNRDDLEGHMDALRYFRSAHALRVAASEVSGTLPLMKVSDYLTYIAEVVLEQALELAWDNLVMRHGHPTHSDGRIDQTPDFAVIGYGKLGGIELSHGSDLDLVFIHNAESSGMSNGATPIDNLTFYTRLGQRIIHILNTQTLSGKLYEVDMRLRPSGNSGMLVSSLAAFEKYQLTSAWTWEHQALVRARVVAGSQTLGEAFDQVRRNVLSQQRDDAKLRDDVADMRRKMREQLGSGSKALQQFNLKQDAGGIVDIEFMVQYAALAWAAKAPEIIQYTDNIRILGSLEEAGLLDAESVAHLIAAYKAYRSTGHRLALQRQEAVLEGDNHFVEERAQVTAIWDRLIGRH